MSPGLREFAIAGFLYLLYSIGRTFASTAQGPARDRATWLLDVENYLGIDAEKSVNTFVSNIGILAVPSAYWYVIMHYAVTVAVLVLLYVRYRERYKLARNAIALATLVGLICYLLFPTSPPRLYDGHYIDTLAMYDSYGWWSDHASAPAGMGGLTNELAALPSLHVGWSLWVAWALWPIAEARLQVFGRTISTLLLSAYPLVTTFVVVATGNHWVLDAVAGAAVVMFGIFMAKRIARWARARHLRILVGPDTESEAGYADGVSR